MEPRPFARAVHLSEAEERYAATDYLRREDDDIRRRRHTLEQAAIDANLGTQWIQTNSALTT
jgi:hypothetical protein